ncbi:MAG: RsmB/NOP family class I SAM-dependent RNA methyltransferase [Tannerella sp.]|jgi:16S rRNA C967 or C1407 C5-methylase (RsmB/RsmF family)/NOL1/NOP2/fmu family ribosome biogenesis protein|nr:RsmB/NOP family class I SAM-dependent RNA methyltransferase [Tannerella sp.]
MLHPDFIERTKELLKGEYEAFEASLDTLPPVSIRIHPQKNGGRDEPQVAWCANGYYLPERPSFTFDPLFHAGTYYVQEAASMFLEQVVRQITANAPVVCLDLCAAPGGKSTHLISLLPDDSLLVSNDVIRSRCAILAENMTKWGYPNSIVTNNDPKDFGRMKHFFDIIVADLPCSGEGMFRKDRESRQEWSVANVELCAARQRRIVHDVWEALKPGGYLVYSTCTFNTEENEDNIVYIARELGADVIEIQTLPEWNITGALKHGVPVCRFLPHKTLGEGFFIALLRKGENARKREGTKARREEGANARKYESAKGAYQDVLLYPDRFYFRENNAVLRTNFDCIQTVDGLLKVVSAGIRLGELKGKDFIPSISLALSTALNRERFAEVELSYEAAIRYLKNETLNLSDDMPKGFVIVKYRNIPLGFVKNIGSRANNLYPKEWRIRKA